MSETTNRNVPSDAAWYCRHDPEEERFYEIFFSSVRSTMSDGPVQTKKKSSSFRRSHG